MENLQFSKKFQEIITSVMFFQLSNFLEGLRPDLGLAWAADGPKTFQKVGKLEEENKAQKAELAKRAQQLASTKEIVAGLKRELHERDQAHALGVAKMASDGGGSSAAKT